MSNFEIHFDISKAEWEKAALRRHDRDVEPVFDLFYGDMVIEVDGHSLFSAPYNMSIADLACGFANMLADGFPDRSSDATFRQGDDSLEVHFASVGDEVVLSGEGASLRTTRMDFKVGARAFISRFAREVWERVPDALNWKDLQVLASYASTDGKQQVVN